MKASRPRTRRRCSSRDNICRKAGVSLATYFKWKMKCAGMTSKIETTARPRGREQWSEADRG